MKPPSCVLTIAGTDPSGGAGIQADLKTFQELKTYGMSVITSCVAQNTTGVRSIHHLPLDFLDEQLRSISDDISVHAVKSGMIATIDMMELVASWMEKTEVPYVLDPVMAAQSGDLLSEQNTRHMWRERLIPLSTLITPNIPEAELLLEKKINTEQDMKQAAILLVRELGCGAALVKGGHKDGEAVDFLYDGKEIYNFRAQRIPTKNTHGTGCTYSAAITACISKGDPVVQAVHKAKAFVTAAIKHSFSIGNGSGPTNHFAIREEVLYHE